MAFAGWRSFATIHRRCRQHANLVRIQRVSRPCWTPLDPFSAQQFSNKTGRVLCAVPYIRPTIDTTSVEPYRPRTIHSDSNTVEEPTDSTPEIDDLLPGSTIITREVLADPRVQERIQHDVANLGIPPLKKSRNMIRHWRLDSRSSLSRSKKQALMHGFRLTPYVVMGAYQDILNRVDENRTSQPNKTVQDVDTTALPFEWFQQTVVELQTPMNAGKKANNAIRHYSDMLEYCKLLIVEETLAKVIRTVLDPYLAKPSLLSRDPPVLHDSGVLLKQVKSMARKQADLALEGSYWLLMLNLGVDQPLCLKNHQLKIVQNTLGPYVPAWWILCLRRLYQVKKTGPSKRLQRWERLQKEYSSLFSTVLEILLLRLDHSDNLLRNSMWMEMQLRRQQKPSQSRSAPYLDYYRIGTAIAMVYQGPDDKRGKIGRALSMELASSLCFDPKLVKERAPSEEKITIKQQRKGAAATATKSKNKPSAKTTKK